MKENDFNQLVDKFRDSIRDSIDEQSGFSLAHAFEAACRVTSGFGHEKHHRILPWEDLAILNAFCFPFRPYPKMVRATEVPEITFGYFDWSGYSYQEVAWEFAKQVNRVALEAPKTVDLRNGGTMEDVSIGFELKREFHLSLWPSNIFWRDFVIFHGWLCVELDDAQVEQGVTIRDIVECAYSDAETDHSDLVKRISDNKKRSIDKCRIGKHDKGILVHLSGAMKILREFESSKSFPVEWRQSKYPKIRELLRTRLKKPC